MRGLDFLEKGVPRFFLIVALVLAGTGLFQCGLTYYRVSVASGWPVTEGRILNRDWRSERWVARSGGGTSFIPEIRYRYSVGGQAYVSENVYPDRPEEWPSQAELEAFLDREFPARSTIPIRYDPADPAQSVLILRGDYGTGITLFACGLVVLFFVFVLRIERGGNRPQQQGAAQPDGP